MPIIESFEGNGWFDSHCHLNDLSNPEQAWKQAVQNQIQNFILPGTEPSQWSLILDSLYNGCFAAFGIHPWFVSDITQQISELNIMLSGYRAIAIGEIGLDFYMSSQPKPERDLQIQAFEKQLELAEYHALPVIIHSVKAHQETVRLLKKRRVRGVVHAFIGSKEVAEQYLKLGMYLGIGPGLLKSKKLQQAVIECPLEKLLLETDAPYMTDQKCQNPLLELVAVGEKLAELKGVSLEAVQRQTRINAFNLFIKDANL